MLCRRCGATIHDGLRVCPHCGERQARQPTHVSCAHCRHRAPAASSVCPRCGQILRARRLPGSVLATVGLIMVAGLVVSAAVLASRWHEVQHSATERLALIETGISELGGKVLDTASSLAVAEAELPTPTPTPVIVLASLPESTAPAVAVQPGLVLAPTTVAAAIGGVPGQPAASAALTVTVQPAVETSPPVVPAPPTPTETVQPTEAPPTATPAATEPAPTVTPSLTPTPTREPATPTPQAVAVAGRANSTYTVQAGDNWFSIAQRLGVTQDSLATHNGARPSDVLQIGQVLRVPAVGGAASASAAAGAAAASASVSTYAVRAGDNWFSIGARFGVTQETLAAHNGQRPTDILQVGQVLRIPPAGAAASMPTATPTPARPAATSAASTPTAPAATPTAEIPVVTRLAAPMLLAPTNGDGFTIPAQPVLSWRPAAGAGPEDYYYVLIRFTLRDGQQSNVTERVTGTSFTVPMWVFDVANPPDRLGVWSVQVRRMGAGNQEIEISPPSESRTFYWR